MEIRINGKLAALKKGTSFEYVAENRLFSGSDSYTLSITFPLRHCPENLAIFGHINRADVVAGKVIFDCEIRDKAFYKFGSVTITEINDAEVKTQFLEGRSEQNFDKTFDMVYINELDLGTPPTTNKNERSPSQAWQPDLANPICVALPWVNDFSGNIQNLADFNAANNSFSWNAECNGLSWQPYLLFLTKKICEAIGYRYDFSKWEAKEEFKFLLVCNTLPHAWDLPDFAHALPHWTVEEFFEKLELFIGGEFDINHRDKSVDFNFSADVLDSIAPVQVDRVIDEHSSEVSQEDGKCDYQVLKNFIYKDCDHEMWKFYSCDWFIKNWQNSAVRYASLSELLKDNISLKDWNGISHRGADANINKLLFAEDVNAYFIVRALSKVLVHEYDGWRPNQYNYVMELRPVNLFGGRISDDSEEADSVEIEFVPAWIDHTDDKFGRLLFLSFSGFDENDSTSTSWEQDPEARKTEIDNTLFQPLAVQSLEAGEKEKKAEYYDRFFIAWWDGAGMPLDGSLPHPFAENIEIDKDWKNFSIQHFSLRLNYRSLSNSNALYSVNPKRKMAFKFLTDVLPNPRAIFFIHGKRYICEKLTANFSEHGMSQLVSGIFWPIAD